jgi:uncharacterized small protein (DUF1192 family)
MGLFDDDIPKKQEPNVVTVGEDLSRLSEDELRDRIGALTAEVNRTREALEQRRTIRNAADAFFQK